MSFKLISAIVAATLAMAAESALPTGSMAPSWSLKDVKDVTYDSTHYRGRKLLIIGGDKASQPDNDQWGERIANTCGHDLASVGIADVSSAPGFMRSRVKKQFQEAESSRPAARFGVPLLLDWDGSVSRAFHFEKKVSNVYLVGPDGVIRFAASGPVTEKALNDFCSAARAAAGG